jgi:diaminopimelate decarboxylase
MIREKMNNNMPATAEINTHGHLSVGGCDVCKLGDEYGTPLYVMDEETIRTNCRNYKEAFAQFFPGSRIVYASKALSVLAVLQIIAEEGLDIDVVSGGELFMAKKAGFPGERIWFHGNNKTEKELDEALEYGVGCFVVDNEYELDLLDKLAAEKGKKAEIFIRIIPGIEAHTHEYIQTGHLDSKFGVHPDIIMDIIKKASGKKNINFRGLHVHIGSQILEVKPYSVLIEVIFDVLRDIKRKLKIDIKELNIGGGLGINYLNKDNAPAPLDLAQAIQSTLQFMSKEYKIPIPKIILEPGRSIVGNAGISLYKIGGIKELKDLRKYAFYDGGMADNIRPALYQAEYDAIIGNKIEVQKKDFITLAGKYCESGDILIKDIQIQPVETGDTLVVFGTGAYNYSMASNYNQALKPGMVLVNKGNIKEIVKRQTYEDLIRNNVSY